METLNIKFDEKKLEEVVKKVTEELKKEKVLAASNGGENERIWNTKCYQCKRQEKQKE